MGFLKWEWILTVPGRMAIQTHLILDGDFIAVRIEPFLGECAGGIPIIEEIIAEHISTGQ